MQQDGHSIIITDYKDNFQGLIIRNNILHGQNYHTFTTTFSDYSGLNIDHNLFTGSANYYGTNYLIDDPEFVDPAQNDFHLQATSPCIDAGSNTLAPIVDFDQVSRPQGPIVDIGPYEYVIDSMNHILSVSCQGMGNIIQIPEQSTYQRGTVVELTAIPENGWIFDYWQGDLTGSMNPTTITMNANKSIVAVFNEEESQIIVTITDIYPQDNSVEVPIKRPFLYAEIDNSKQTPINWSITIQPNVGTKQGQIINGPIVCLLQTLEFNTTYEWVIHLETENGWENTSYSFTTEHKQKTSIYHFTSFFYSYFSWFLTLFRIM